MKKIIYIVCLMCLLLSLSSCNTKDPSDTPQNDSPVTSTIHPQNNTPQTSEEPQSPTDTNTAEKLLEGKTDEEKALFIWEYQRNDDIVSSYTADMSFCIEGTTQNGIAVEMNMTGKLAEANRSSNTNLSYYEDSEVSYSVAGNEYPKIVTKMGYSNGRIFLYTKDGTSESGIYARHSVDDWNSYKKLKAGKDDQDPPITKENCRSLRFEQLADGYRAVYTDFTEDVMKQIDDSFGSLSNGLLDQKHSNMEITVETDNKLLPKKIIINYIYENTEDSVTPKCSISAEYHDYNNTKIPSVDFSSYRDVGNILAIERFNKKRASLTEALTISFAREDTTIVKSGGTTVSQSTTSYSVVACGLYNNTKYSFCIMDENSDQMWRYENGIYSYCANGAEVSNQLLSDAQARSIIDTLIDIVPIDETKITKASEPSTGYDFELTDFDISMFNSLLDTLGATKNDIKSQKAVINYMHRLNTDDFGVLGCRITIEVQTAHASYTITHEAIVSSVMSD